MMRFECNPSTHPGIKALPFGRTCSLHQMTPWMEAVKRRIVTGMWRNRAMQEQLYAAQNAPFQRDSVQGCTDAAKTEVKSGRLVKSFNMWAN